MSNYEIKKSLLAHQISQFCVQHPECEDLGEDVVQLNLFPSFPNHNLVKKKRNPASPEKTNNCEITKSIPAYIHQIARFFVQHPECEDLSSEMIQDLEGMWFCKTAIEEAGFTDKVDIDLSVRYPTEKECVLHSLQMLLKQTMIPIARLPDVDLEFIQDTIRGLCYRKSIIRQALIIIANGMSGASPPVMTKNQKRRQRRKKAKLYKCSSCVWK